MMSNDPISLAWSLLEAKKKEAPSEELLKAMKEAKKNGKKSFTFEGKRYNVSEMGHDDEEHDDEMHDDEEHDDEEHDDEEHEDEMHEKKRKMKSEGAYMNVEDEEVDDGGETVPSSSTRAAQKGPKTKKPVNKPSDADDDDVAAAAKVKGQKVESLKIDIDAILDSYENEIEDLDALTALFSEEDDLSEHFKKKAAVIFEAAIKARVRDFTNKAVSQLEEQYTSQVTDIQEELTDSIDGYLQYVVEQWVEENQVAVDRGIKTDITESFMMGLKQLFESHYIDMPENKYSLLESMEDEMNALKVELNSQMKKNIDLTRQLGSSEAKAVFAEEAEGMVDTESEKFANLAEGIDYDDIDDYREKLQTIKETFFNSRKSLKPSRKKLETLEEEVSIDSDAQRESFSSTELKSYVAFLDRQARNKE
jgi:hypothetical protein